MPSVTATLIEAVPDENDDFRAEEEAVGKNVAASAYVGKNYSTAVETSLTN